MTSHATAGRRGPVAGAPRRRRPDPWLLGALAVSAGLGLFHLDWGLPAGEHSWAVDALEPLTVLSIVRHSFAEWNSGWFYFKYPLAYPLSIGALYAPYLGWLFASGGWTPPTAAHPTGFTDPDHAVYLLALLGRGFSVACTLGSVAAAYGITRRLAGVTAGRLAGWLVATCYPVVYYAHTMNVDASYMFWLLLALYCAVLAGQTDRAAPWVGLGAAAAMAVSTKEQAFGFLLALPVLAVVVRGRVHGAWRVCLSRPALWMALAAIGTAAAMNNALWNPLGVVARSAYLLGHPLSPVDAPLKPVAFAFFKGEQELVYAGQLWAGLRNALGLPLLSLAIAGVVGLWRAPRAAGWLLLPGVAYYYLSLRGQELITMRYSLPVALLAILLASVFLAQLRAQAGGRAARAVLYGAIVTVAALSFARGIELDLLLRNDSRYQAEAWMRSHLQPGARGEVYQKPTYLPRFAGGVTAITVPIEARTISGLLARRPDFVVLSSASRQSISHRWNPDWRTSGTLLLEEPEAVRLLRALTREDLGYRRAALLRQQPRLLRLGITGLCPEIAIYTRVAGETEGGPGA